MRFTAKFRHASEFSDTHFDTFCDMSIVIFNTVSISFFFLSIMTSKSFDCVIEKRLVLSIQNIFIDAYRNEKNIFLSINGFLRYFVSINFFAMYRNISEVYRKAIEIYDKSKNVSENFLIDSDRNVS